MSNVLVLMSDEHNPRYAAPYGHTVVRTPNMARLAAEGTVFNAAYCPSPLCMPSRSAWMAGQRTHTLQTYSNCNALVDPTPLSFGAALDRQGIHAAYIGKTDVYASAETLGFTEMRLPIDRPRPGDTNHRRNPMTIRKGSAERANGYGTRADAGAGDLHCVDEALAWLQSPAAQEDNWVLVVNVTNPHFPHIAQPALWEMYAGCGDLPSHGPECASAQHPYARALRDHFETHDFREEQIRGLRRGYLACITFVDRQLGRLLDALEAEDLDATTDVIYTSDHGEMLGKFGMWWKCSLYEDAVRVPVIAAGPDFARGTCVTTPVDLHDVQATLFAATGAEQPAGWLGTPLYHVEPDDPERIVFAEYHGHGTPGSSFMVRRGPWKYLYHVGAPNQLFNLASDPEELVNLAATEPDIAGDMETELRRICNPEHEHDRAEAFIRLQLQAIQNEGETS
jgi:choline-sulfatase